MELTITYGERVVEDLLFSHMVYSDNDQMMDAMNAYIKKYVENNIELHFKRNMIIAYGTERIYEKYISLHSIEDLLQLEENAIMNVLVTLVILEYIKNTYHGFRALYDYLCKSAPVELHFSQLTIDVS